MSVRCATRSPRLGASSRPSVGRAPSITPPAIPALITFRREGRNTLLRVLIAHLLFHVTPPACYTNVGHAPDADRRSNLLAAHPRHPRRHHLTNRRLRRNLPRAARVVREKKRHLPPTPSTQVLLHPHLRILLQ